MGASRKRKSRTKKDEVVDGNAVPDKPAKEIAKPKTQKSKKESAENAAVAVAVASGVAASSDGVLLLKKPKKQQRHSVEMVPNKWEDWKEVYLVGTEWHNYDEAFKVDWDFEHVEKQLSEGDLASDKLVGKHVYLFGSTEPQLVQLKKTDEKETVVHIPVIIAIVSSLPPPETLGIKSVQMVEESIVPMSDLKMSWAPYIAHDAAPDRERPKIYFLHCARRRTSLKSMKPDEVKKYEYCMPYVPSLDTSFADLEEDTEVHIVTSAAGKGLVFNFDWTMDELEPFLDDLVKDNSLSDQDREDVKKLIGDEVKTKKKQISDEKDARRKKAEAVPEKQRLAIKEMIKYKFYPQNAEPDIGRYKSPFINRYYGSAQKVL